ncbi:MAG: cupin domain-containing protein [Algiphilus sp.]
MHQNLNAELDRPVRADTQAMEWSPSPSGTVWRKRVHRAGPEEAGQVTSVVRYDPEAAFPTHDHPDGEEILVLDGVFSDEHGHWPAGSYLLHPEGFRHTPFSQPGCLLFVKLRQYPGARRKYVACQTHDLPWQPGDEDGVARKCLYQQEGFSDETWLERWAPGTSVQARGYPEGAELFVINGAVEDDNGALTKGCWMRLPAGAHWNAHSDAGCTLYVKRGGLRYLLSVGA